MFGRRYAHRFSDEDWRLCAGCITLKEIDLGVSLLRETLEGLQEKK